VIDRKGAQGERPKKDDPLKQAGALRLKLAVIRKCKSIPRHMFSGRLPFVLRVRHRRIVGAAIRALSFDGWGNQLDVMCVLPPDGSGPRRRCKKRIGLRQLISAGGIDLSETRCRRSNKLQRTRRSQNTERSKTN
jgi:hypothetical protein